MSEKKKIFYIENDSTYFINNRLELAKNALENGYEVHVATLIHSSDDRNIIEKQGIKFYCQQPALPNNGLKFIYQKIREVNPAIVHIFTINASIRIGVFLLCYKRLNLVFSITGLGYAFISKSLYATAIRMMLKILIPALKMKHNLRFIFQNGDDKSLFDKKYNLKENQSFLILGSGVNIEKFSPQQTNNSIPAVLFVGRLLRDKGIYDFIEACKILKNSNISAKFIIAGDIDKKNPASLSEAELNDIVTNPVFDYRGYVKNVNELLHEIDIACLPSYREGLSKFLLEAGASGKPIVTTNVPGCKEIVQNGENGFVTPLKNPIALSKALKKLCLNQDLREQMGANSRKMIEHNFAMSAVIKQINNVYTTF